MEYFENTEFTDTFIGTGLNSSRVYPSKISIVISVVDRVVFNFTSLRLQNLTKISFACPGSSLSTLTGSILKLS